MGPVGVGIILDPAGEASLDRLVCIVKRVLLIQGVGVFRSGNPIGISDLPVGVSEREIIKGSDSTNSYPVSMGFYTP